MSNWTRMRLSPQQARLRELRGRCHDRISAVCREQRSLAEEMRQQSQACHNVARQLRGLFRRQEKVDMSLKELSGDLQNLLNTISQLERESASLARYMAQTARDGESILNKAR